MLLNAAGLIWAGRRIPDNDSVGEWTWQMPQGGIDQGEDPRTAALRELKEETGTDRAEILAETRDWLRYELPPEVMALRKRNRFRGQDQKWFAMRFLGEDAEFDLEHHQPEFDEWAWIEAERLPELIVPFKRPVYERVIAEFRPLIDAAREGR
jgi:putative (di)nucleoside polyphosphate hydrolase